MKRREFLALGTSTALAGATVPRRALAGDRVDPAFIRPALEEFDRMVEATRAWFAPSADLAPDRALAEVAGRLWVSLAAYAAFLELPLQQQVHPAFQTRIRTAAGGFGRAAIELNEILGADDPGLWDRLEEGFKRLPDLKGALAQGEREARRVGVTAVGRRRLMTMLRRALEEVQRQGVRATVQSVGDITITRGPPAPSTDARLNAEVASYRAAWLEAEPAEAMPLPSSEPAATDVDVGMIALGIVVIVLGGAIVYAGAAIIAAIPFCPCIGGLVLILGLVVVVGGAAMIAIGARKKPEAPRVTEN